ncbi:MAG: hypothetical protein BGO26_18545 [Actinobacteria bacterium 69-20]|jgi:hypothetical protein|nr:hypothetical protein [Actinomycetota bacterium]OJV24576.1 MAG: hypothetical protein BGO26_18545 [Actinobacteria bacterium 69-20]
MSHSVTRHDGAAWLAAVGYLAEGGIVLAEQAGFAGTTDNRLLNLSYAVAVLAAAVALPAVTSHIGLRRKGAGWLGIIGSWLAQAGLVAMGVESGVAVVHEVTALGMLFVIGIVLSVAGLLVLAIGGAIAGAPRWLAVLPLLAVLAAAAGGDFGASIVSGALWVGVAWLIRSRTATATAPLLDAAGTS